MARRIRYDGFTYVSPVQRELGTKINLRCSVEFPSLKMLEPGYFSADSYVSWS